MTGLASLTVISVINEAVPTIAAMDNLAAVLASRVDEFDVVLVANAIAPALALELKAMLAGACDTTAVFLGERVHDDLARLVGIEHAVGDAVVLCDLGADDPACLAPLLAQLAAGYDLVIGDPPRAIAQARPRFSQMLVELYMRLYGAMTGITLERRPTGLRVLSREAALFVAGRPNAELLLRARAIGAAFPAVAIAIPPTHAIPTRAIPAHTPMRHSWSASIGMLLSVSTVPLRGASLAALLGGVLSVLYSVYVFLIYLLKPNVAAGWTTISLQLSGMMFIFSLVLLFVSEYVMQIHSASPPRSRRYRVVRELRSTLSRRSLRLNVVDAQGRFALGQPEWLRP